MQEHKEGEELLSCVHKDIFHHLMLFSFFFYSYVHTMFESFLPRPLTPSLTTHLTPSLSPPPPQYQQKLFCPSFSFFS
jgi:hypothetical protein